MRIAALMLVMSICLHSAGAHAQDAAQRSDGFKTAIFAGGCFWYMERAFDSVKGVVKTTSGYSGGHVENPTFYDVTNGATGHREVVEVLYDPKIVNFKQLAAVYFRAIDPTDAGGQFCDRGERFSTAIFFQTEEEGKAAASAKLQAEYDIGKPVMTRLIPYKNFYPVEEYHQDFYMKENKRYKFTRGRCGNDKRLKEVWGWKAVIPDDAN